MESENNISLIIELEGTTCFGTLVIDVDTGMFKDPVLKVEKGLSYDQIFFDGNFPLLGVHLSSLSNIRMALTCSLVSILNMVSTFRSTALQL